MGQKRFPQYGISIWSLWPNIRFLPSIVAEKNVTKNILGRMKGQTEVKQYTTPSGGAGVKIGVLTFIYWVNKIHYEHFSSGLGVRVMVFNTTFNKISVISWRSVLLVKETRLPVENHRPASSHWRTLSHNVVSSTPRLSRIRTHNINGDMHWLHR